MPDDAPKKYPSRALIVFLLGGTAVTSVLVILSGSLISVFLFIPFLIALRRLGRRRWWQAALCLNPVTLAVAWAVGTYACGTACLWSHGMLRPGFHRLDSETRLPVSSYCGCLVEGPDTFIADVHNLTLRSCTAALGLMWSAPRGPYPQREEILRGWEGAETLAPQDVTAGHIIVNGEEREIPNAGELLSLVGFDGTGQDDPERHSRMKVLARDFGGGTYALRLTYSFDSDYPSYDAVVLYGGSPVRVLDAVAVPDTLGMAQPALAVLR